MPQSTFPRGWAIRQKSTGYFLPNGPYITKEEPTPCCWPKTYPSATSARRALARWVEGRWSLSYTRDYETGYVDGADWGPEKVPGRNKDDMEVTLVTMVDL